MGATLKIGNLSKNFGSTEVLRQISLDIAAGSFVSLLGPSGCGKSTLLRIVAGFEAQDRGSISLDDQIIDHLAPRARRLAMVFQSYALYPHMTVAENISLPLEMQHLSGTQRLPLVGRFLPGSQQQARSIKEKTRQVAALAEIEHLLDKRPAQLSGGQRQRVALARAMVREPALFLMDEPLSNLDAKLRVTMRAELVALNRRLGATMLYVTHDQTEAMTMSDRIALMMHGEILQYDTPDKLYTRPVHLDVATFIGQPTINCLSAKTLKSGAGRILLKEAEACQLVIDELEEELTVAIRPEALILRPTPSPNTRLSMPVTLDRVELLGAEVLLWCTATRTGRSIVAQARAADHHSLAASGMLSGPLWLDAAGSGVHVFDKSGDALETVDRWNMASAVLQEKAS